MVNPSQQLFTSGLYLVATPIGNLQDMTLRALSLLEKADLIACEDTRISGKLLSHFGIKAPLLSYNDHNAPRQTNKLMDALEQGKIVALISDAGMPLISDPGYKLVQHVANAGHYVTSLPGASAPLMALQLSALPSDQFCFLGFVPNKDSARITFWQDWQETKATLIAFETAPRILSSLKTLKKVLGNRQVAIARELTKRYEEVKRGTADELIDELEAAGAQIKGEIVLVISGRSDTDNTCDGDIDALLTKHMKDNRLKDAVDIVVGLTGQKKKLIYERALALKNADET